MKRLVHIVFAVLFVALTAFAENTTRGKLISGASNRKIKTIDDTTVVADENAVKFDAKSVSFSGFKKRASDTKESFYVTNNSAQHISQIQLLMRYTDVNGGIIAERIVLVPCDVLPGQTQRVSVKSFDSEKCYHYRYGSKPRLQSTPFDVAVRLLRYDIAVKK